MKANQASIYRKTEELLEFTIPIARRLPKTRDNEVTVARLLGNLYDTLDFICIALQAEPGKARLDVLNMVIVRMTAVKTIFRQMNMRREVSHGQYARFIEFANLIGTELGSWRNKQLSTIRND